MSSEVKFVHLEAKNYSNRSSGYFKGNLHSVDMADLATLIDWSGDVSQQLEDHFGHIHDIEYVSTTLEAEPRLFIPTAFGKTTKQYLNEFLAGVGADYYFISSMRSPVKVRNPSRGQIVIPLYVEENNSGDFTIEVYPSVFVPDLKSASVSKRNLFSQVGDLDYEDRFVNVSEFTLRSYYSDKVPFLIMSNKRSLQGLRDRVL